MKSEDEAAPPENEIRIRVEDETARALKLISLKSLLVRPSPKAVLFVTAADFLCYLVHGELR